MEKCPQCDAERIEGENFCDNCGHKYGTTEQAAPQTEPEPQVQDSTPEQSVETPANSEPQGVIWMQNTGGAEHPIYFDSAPTVVGRQDVSEFLKSQNIDPLQISRKQCTLFKEESGYYIEDGVTSVQDKPSGNHTTVNGKDITGHGKVQLNDNDKIIFATIAEAIFRIG